MRQLLYSSTEKPNERYGRVAERCSVLHCVAERCSVLQCVALLCAFLSPLQKVRQTAVPVHGPEKRAVWLFFLCAHVRVTLTCIHARARIHTCKHTQPNTHGHAHTHAQVYPPTYTHTMRKCESMLVCEREMCVDHCTRVNESCRT